VSELQTCLQPFMVAQKPLEGQAYATICLGPYTSYKARTNLTIFRNSSDSSPHVLSVALECLKNG
jgi:hypothetical protein